MTLTGNNGFVTQMTTTDATGNYSFTGIPAGNDYTLTPSKTGAPNGLESFDAALVARFVAGLDIPTPNQVIAGDADGDGILTSFDASLIARYVAGLSGYGFVSTWKFVPANYMYTTLGGNQTNQDFTAILVGETSGNWFQTGPIGAPAAELRSWIDANEDNAADSPQPSNGVTLSLARTRALPGASITIPINVSSMTGSGVKAFDLDIAFDPSMLQPQEVPVDTQGTLASGMFITPNAANPGHLIISGFQTTDLSGAGALLNLKFIVTGAAGQTSAIKFADYADEASIMHPAARLNGGQPLAFTVDGNIKIAGGSGADSISGRVVNADGRPIRNVVVTLSSNSLSVPLRMATTSFGTYAFSSLHRGETYVVTVNSQRFNFEGPSRVVLLEDNVINADFIANALPGGR